MASTFTCDFLSEEFEKLQFISQIDFLLCHLVKNFNGLNDSINLHIICINLLNNFLLHICEPIAQFRRLYYNAVRFLFLWHFFDISGIESENERRLIFFLGELIE